MPAVSLPPSLHRNLMRSLWFMEGFSTHSQVQIQVGHFSALSSGCLCDSNPIGRIILIIFSYILGTSSATLKGYDLLNKQFRTKIK
jgi:hypothetical protein